MHEFLKTSDVSIHGLPELIIANVNLLLKSLPCHFTSKALQQSLPDSKFVILFSPVYNITLPSNFTRGHVLQWDRPSPHKQTTFLKTVFKLFTPKMPLCCLITIPHWFVTNYERFLDEVDQKFDKSMEINEAAMFVNKPMWNST